MISNVTTLQGSKPANTVTIAYRETCDGTQVQGAPGHVAQYKSAMHCLQCILKEEGPKAFYRGTLSSYLKVCPSIAVTYGLYAFIIQLWGIGGLRSAYVPDQ